LHAAYQIGVESGRQEILDAYNKGKAVDEIERAVSILCVADIPAIYGNFIIGGTRETAEAAQKSIDLAKRLKASAPGRMECGASIPAIYPGTVIYKDPAKHGLKIIDRQIKRAISGTYPMAAAERWGEKEILLARYEFLQEISNSCRFG